MTVTYITTLASQTRALTVDSTYNPAGGEHRHNTNKGASNDNL
jgi:hypothetical protein